MSGKFRDKETGVEGYLRANRYIEYQIEDEKGVPINGSFKTLSELLEKWEEIDEEPNLIPDQIFLKGSRVCIDYRNKEAGRKAKERLEAWKRLRDKGFRFDGYDVAHNSNGDLCGQLFYNAGDYCIEDVEKDLDLLFGGEIRVALKIDGET